METQHEPASNGFKVRCSANKRFRAFALLAFVAAATLVHAGPASAEPYPSRPVTLVVPQAAGGTNDIVGRLVGQKLGEVLNNASVVVDNRPGAGGNIGTQLVAKGPKDGYTLLMTISSSQAINPALYKNPGFDPVKDFKPVGLIGAVPNVLLVNPSFPAKDFSEFLKLARQKGANYQYASAGNGTLNHLLGEMLNSMAGISLQHVPYKGVAPALNDVLGGQLPIVFASLPSALAHIKAGKLRALAVSGDRRSPVLPDVPTIAEAVPGYNGTLWIGLFAPAGVPADVLATLQEATRKALAAKDLRDKLEQQGVEIAPPTSPDQFSKLLQDDLAKWARIVKASGAAVD
ncbi:tripartite tricarboxylate transporter substrate binding protein [Variovorax sp. GB1P17]|uniref:tripartite tricarboxylate transporter substrate binding protein n=1 Tax=Variovorax sp. GB1P17 TaxID=3443740 RepID=UPI003F488489